MKTKKGLLPDDSPTGNYMSGRDKKINFNRNLMFLFLLFFVLLSLFSEEESMISENSQLALTTKTISETFIHED